MFWAQGSGLGGATVSSSLLLERIHFRKIKASVGPWGMGSQKPGESQGGSLGKTILCAFELGKEFTLVIGCPHQGWSESRLCSSNLGSATSVVGQSKALPLSESPLGILVTGWPCTPNTTHHFHSPKICPGVPGAFHP